MDTNIKGTLNVLNAARELDTQRVLVTSTSEVYGTSPVCAHRPKSIPSRARAPTRPPRSAPTAWPKVSSTRSFDLPVTIVRPFNTYGPRQSGRAIIPTIITQLLAGQTEIKLGSLTPTRDFNYVKDTANGFMTIADCDEPPIGQELNIATGVEHSIGDLAHELIAQINPNATIVCEAERLRPEKSEVNRLLGDATKLRNLTGWKPQYTFEQGPGRDHRILARQPRPVQGRAVYPVIWAAVTEPKDAALHPPSGPKPRGGLSCWRPVALLGVVLSYYWRVFYGLDARGIPPLWPTALCVGLGVAAGIAVLALRPREGLCRPRDGLHPFVRASCLFFANPPLQNPR